ncbi:hypothetical protein [uncultured Sphingomonas sp.]|uniref:hypothetical protein n=1 Tax=uncultured Sphingomonas sp. TaxID=158754 RepID=UPI0035CAC8B6
MRDLVDRMLTMIDRGSWSAEGDDLRFGITIAQARIDFDTMTPTVGLAFERLAATIEATIAAERARRMIEVAGVTSQPPPLWLVSGSDILAHWLVWAGASNALRKVLALTDQVGLAPVYGDLDRRARRELGQGGAKIRVRGGMAIAERIELSNKPRCTAVLGQDARIRIENHKLPDTLIDALQQDERRNALRALAEVVSHPFFTAADLRITGVTNAGSAVVFEVESRWAPLEPVPDAVLAVLPADADPVFPWRAPPSERRRLDCVVEEARHRVAATGDPR